MNRISSLFRLSIVTVAAILMLGGSGSFVQAIPRPKSSLPAARLGREFKLRARQQVTLKGETLRIRFAEVTEDSRCPTDVQCVWAGNAAVRLEVSRGGRRSRSLTLNTSGNSPTVKYGNYEIKLVELKPHPKSTRKVAQPDYVVTLLVNQS